MIKLAHRNTTTNTFAQEEYLCGQPCSLYGSGSNFICVRQADGDTTALSADEATTLRRISHANKTSSDWINTLCAEDIQLALQAPATTRRHMLSAWLAGAMRRTLNQNQDYSHTSLYKQYAAILNSLVVKGLLSRATIVNDPGCALESARITTLGIPTYSRGTYLSKCITSFIRNMRLHNRTDADILVVDDSYRKDSEDKTRQLIQSLRERDAPLLYCAGYKERETFLHALFETQCAPLDVLSFALLPEKTVTTEGAVRNTILLMRAGRYILQTDDDTICAYASTSARESRIAISSQSDPYQTHFYQNRLKNLSDFPLAMDVDPFASHEIVLGASIPDLTQDQNDISWVGINPHLLVGRNSRSRIDISTTGTSGDSGMTSSWAFLVESPPETLSRIYATPESFRCAMNDREIFRCVEGLTISRGSLFQAMSFALNNTRTQPPFFPMGRGLDSLFAAIYHKSDSGAFIGHLPLAIAHESEAKRSYIGWPSGDYQKAGNGINYIPLSLVVRLCLGSVQSIDGATVQDNLRLIGEQLAAIASLSNRAFRVFIREQYVQLCCHRLSLIDSLLATKAAGSEQWTRDLRRLSNECHLAMIAKDFCWSSDLMQIVGSESAMVKTQEYVLSYARLLSHWDNICIAAKDLSARL